MKVFSVVGYAKSGKTTVVKEIIKGLKRRGFSVATVKNMHSNNVNLNDKGDTAHFYESGSDVVVGVSDEKSFIIEKRKYKLHEIIRNTKVDYLIIEGMKEEPLPQIVCAETKEDLNDLAGDNAFAVSGIVANELSQYKELPVINGISDTDRLIGLIEEKVFDVLPLEKKCKACGLNCKDMTAAILKGKRKRTDCVLDAQKDVIIKVNGEKVILVPFVKNSFADMIKAYVKNLRGYKKGKIEIMIEE